MENYSARYARMKFNLQLNSPYMITPTKTFLVFLIIILFSGYGYGADPIARSAQPEIDVGSKTVKLVLNNLVNLNTSDTGVTYQSNDFQILTFQPQGEYSVDMTIASGGSDNIAITLPPGSPTANAVLHRFNENAISITNQSIAPTTVSLGYFGPAADPTHALPASGGKVALAQYQSLGLITMARPMILTIECRNSQSMLFALMAGAEAPKLIALNTDKNKLPKQYAGLTDYLEIQKANIYTLSKNWEGVALFIVNISIKKADQGKICNCVISPE